MIALQLSRESYTLLPGETAIDVKAVQFSKAQRPIEVTVSGINIEVNLSQPANACSSIDVTPSGIVNEVISRALSKA